MKNIIKIFLLVILFPYIINAQGMGPGPGIKTYASGSCGGATDIGNGWCLIASASAASANTTSVTTTGIDTTGADLIIMVISSYSGIYQVVLGDASDSKSNTWSSGKVSTSSGSSSIIFYTKPSSVGSSHTFTVSNASASFPIINIFAVSGSHASPLDQTEENSQASGTSIQAGSITPSQNNCLVISGWALVNANGGPPSINSSFTSYGFFDNDGINHQTGMAAYKTQSTAAAVDPTWSWSTGTLASATTLVSFKHS